MVRRFSFLLVFALSILVSCSSSPAEKKIREAVASQMQSYPESTLKDLYKNFFQDAFGPGHLMDTSKNARENMASYVKSECESVKGDASPCPLYESTGYVGRFYRVNLSVISDGTIPFDEFMDAFLRSAEQFSLPPIDEWKKEWSVIESIIQSMNLDLPDYDADSKSIRDLLDSGEYASHHSKAYENAYRPHYRLIEKSIFEKELLPYIN